jgi:hypothetical protein
MFAITSGDPKRGTMALESDAAPPEGAQIQVSIFRFIYSSK